MNTLSFDTKYSPVRIGWCICKDDFDSLIKAFRFNHCLWGGGFNPIIVVDDEKLARRMIDLFKVDVLLSVDGEKRSEDFIKSVKHLPYPYTSSKYLFDGGNCRFLDIHHPLKLYHSEFVKYREDTYPRTIQFNWSPDDPCAGIFEAMFGSYPPKEEIKQDYWSLVSNFMPFNGVTISPEKNFTHSIFDDSSPSFINKIGLRPDWLRDSSAFTDAGSGLYFGNSQSFSDLVDFWNLNAAGNSLFFYDPNYSARFAPVIEDIQRRIKALPVQSEWDHRTITIWEKLKMTDTDRKMFSLTPFVRQVREEIWGNKNSIQPVSMLIEESLSIAQYSNDEPKPTITVQLSKIPAWDKPSLGLQEFVVNVHPVISPGDRFVFRCPNLPELNEFFGRNHIQIGSDEARARPDGVGIITELYEKHLTIVGMDRFLLGAQLFKIGGIEAETSSAGLVCEQLIRQMGGLQGCRVFKIPGVRKLIEEIDSTKEFDRSRANILIGNLDPIKNAPVFETFENLYLEPREAKKLKPEDAFIYLLKKNVFRAGLKLKCDSCKLEFWRVLDDVKTIMACEYCGRDVNVAMQLKDRNWAYKPSGLFGRNDKQEGGVPVALTLQQLDTALGSDIVFWLPAMKLKFTNEPDKECETDFVLVCQSREGKVQLVIGECKTNQEITDDDVANLSKVADSFTAEQFDVFIVFSKTGDFKPEEIERCRKADLKSLKRTILLSARELEPYRMYEHVGGESQPFLYDDTLQGMVKTTNATYFSPTQTSQK